MKIVKFWLILKRRRFGLFYVVDVFGFGYTIGIALQNFETGLRTSEAFLRWFFVLL